MQAFLQARHWNLVGQDPMALCALAAHQSPSSARPNPAAQFQHRPTIFEHAPTCYRRRAKAMNYRPQGSPSSASLEVTLNSLLTVAFRTTLRHHEELMERCAKKITFRRVHALRIETRRLLAKVALMEGLCSAGKGKFCHALKHTLRATTDMSDARAQILLLDDVAPRHPEVKPFARHLRQWQRRAVQFCGT